MTFNSVVKLQTLVSRRTNRKIKALKSQNLLPFAIAKTNLSETKTGERYSVLISTLTISR